MKKISLILPVYNVEQYLPKCIESCLCQDLSETEYEIIIVIDGSLDNSLSIAKKYQQNTAVSVLWNDLMEDLAQPETRDSNTQRENMCGS